MAETKHKGVVAGDPPWLLMVFVLLIFNIPNTIEMYRANIEDFLTIEEMQRLPLLVEKIEDGSSFFYFDMISLNSIDKIAPDEILNWIKQENIKAEQRYILLRDWLMGGACARFRISAAHALSEIDQSRYIDEEMKALLRQLVQIKKESLFLLLDELGDDELLALARQESSLNPPINKREEIINYLIEVDDERRERLSSDWKELEKNLLKTSSTIERGKVDSVSIDVLRSRLALVMNKPAFLMDLGILLIPILGLATVILPHLRGWALEKRFGLRENTGSVPEIDEMQTFVTKNAPRIELRVNLLRSGFAFVYPKGYRRPRLAVLGGMYALWRSEPEKAKDILLHEIEHVRQGDYLLVGYGSFFVKYLKWLVICFIVLMIATLISGIVFSLGSIGFNLAHQGKTFGTQVVMMLSSTVSIVFLLMSRIILPLMGIWALELNADFAVSRERALKLEYSGTATRLIVKFSRIFGSLSHPPLWLRTWLGKKNDWSRSFVRQVFFPSSFLLWILLFFLMGIFAKLPSQGFQVDTMIWLLGLCQESFARLYLIFGGMALIVFLWPHLSGSWERFFVGEGRVYRRWDGGRFMAGIFLVTLAALAYLVQLDLS